ncbi:MAG: SMI1/KNR4 family protein [Lachnospiraceae bacterium]|nr:SMI1/KNR4 family protein [Lachnospiraceae bacterium]
MISDELKKIVEQLNDQGKMCFCEPAAEDEIAEFEKKHNIVLPSKYKEWLLFSDGGEFYLPAGVQMYGVSHRPVINVEDTDRPDDTYIVIGALDSGDPVLCEKAGEKIAVYNHEEGTIEDDEVYDDFIAFLKGMYDLLGIEE